MANHSLTPKLATDQCPKIVSTVELQTLYIQELPYMNTFCECILKKNRTYACTFPVQRKEINVVQFRFTMRYSSRRLSNEKVLTTACNF